MLLSAVWSAEFVTLLLWKLSYVRPSSRGQLGWVRWQRCGQMAALSPSFSSAFLLRPRGQNKSLILLSLAARLPSCMPDTVAVIYTHLYFSVFEHISEHKTCSRTRAHVHIQNSHRARLSLQQRLLRFKIERWNTSACLCCRWSICGLRSLPWRTPSSAQQTLSHCKTQWESSVNITHKFQPSGRVGDRKLFLKDGVQFLDRWASALSRLRVSSLHGQTQLVSYTRSRWFSAHYSALTPTLFLTPQQSLWGRNNIMNLDLVLPD